MSKNFDALGWDDSTRYFQSYFATVDTLNTALHKMKMMAQKATDPADFSRYSAKALQISGDLELLKNKRRAFLANKSAINPPSDATVAKLVALSIKVAKMASTAAAFSKILKAVSNALVEFDNIQSDV